MPNAPTEKGGQPKNTKKFVNCYAYCCRVIGDGSKQGIAPSSVSFAFLFSDIKTPKYMDFIYLNIVYTIILVLVETCFNNILMCC